MQNWSLYFCPSWLDTLLVSILLIKCSWDLNVSIISRNKKHHAYKILINTYIDTVRSFLLLTKKLFQLISATFHHSETACPHFSTRPPSCVTPRQPTIDTLKNFNIFYTFLIYFVMISFLRIICLLINRGFNWKRLGNWSINGELLCNVYLTRQPNNRLNSCVIKDHAQATCLALVYFVLLTRLPNFELSTWKFKF